MSGGESLCLHTPEPHLKPAASHNVTSACTAVDQQPLTSLGSRDDRWLDSTLSQRLAGSSEYFTQVSKLQGNRSGGDDDL